MAKRTRKANYPSPHALAPHAHKNITAFSRHVFVSPPTNPHCDGTAFPVAFPSWRCRVCRPQCHHTKLRSANHTQKIAANPTQAFCTEKFTKCPPHICRYSLPFPPHTLRQIIPNLTATQCMSIKFVLFSRIFNSCALWRDVKLESKSTPK